MGFARNSDEKGESPDYVIHFVFNKINKSVKVWNFGGKQISYIELEYGVTYRSNNEAEQGNKLILQRGSPDYMLCITISSQQKIREKISNWSGGLN